MPSPSATDPIDRVDDHDQPIGLVARGDAISSGANFRTVHVFVFDDAGRLLMQRLPNDHSRSPNRWGSSVASYLNYGETYEQAASRRLREELGLAAGLHYVGKTKMLDKGSTKFVALFTTASNRADNRRPDEISALRYCDERTIEAELKEEPDNFTDTFRVIYKFYRHRV